MSASPAVNELDGGYIVEVDVPLDCFNDEALNLQHHTPQDVRICVDTPDEGAITPAQLCVHQAAPRPAECDIYAKRDLARINPVSFADWYLLSELFRNYDAVFYSSDLMWKDTGAAAIPADRVLNMGPIWDFDISAGNIPFDGNWEAEGCWVSRPGRSVPNWFSALFDNPRLPEPHARALEGQAAGAREAHQCQHRDLRPQAGSSRSSATSPGGR